MEYTYIHPPGGSEVKVSACNMGNLGSIPGSGRYPGERNGNPLQDSCLENPMERGVWQATVHRVTKKLNTTEHLYREENKAFSILTKRAVPNCSSNAFKGPSLGFYLM